MKPDTLLKEIKTANKHLEGIKSKLSNLTCEFRQFNKLHRKNTAWIIFLIFLFLIFLCFLLATNTLHIGREDSIDLLSGKFFEEGLTGISFFFISADLPSSHKEEVNSNSLSVLVYEIIECESNWRPDVYGDNGRAYGLAQFHEPTFDWMCELSGMDLDYYNSQHQIKLLKWALENNLGHHWTCYQKLVN